MPKNSNYRHELKYRCSAAQLAILESRLQNVLAHDSHAKNGQYSIRSMYFDNYANRCYIENENGTDPREKFRIRIYNADDSRISLECKRKEQDKTYKTACLLSKQMYESLLHGGELNLLGAQPDVYRKFTLLMQTQQFKPAVIVEYDRAPYVYPIGNVRITLDKNIRAASCFERFFEPHIPSRLILPKGQHLLEVKYDELLPDFIKEIIQLENLQRISFSKYYLCRKFSMGGLL